MELRRFKYFLSVAAEGSLNRASRSLGIAQPALGRQMQLLEAELGVRLFERLPRGMRLTDEGEYLCEALGHPLQLFDVAIQNVRSFATRVEATGTLGLPPVVAGLLAPRLLERLAMEMPNLKLSVIEDGAARLAGDLVRGKIDVAMVTGFTPDDRLFHSEVLSEKLALVGAPVSALAGRAQVSFAELEQFPLILPSAPATLPVTLEKLAARTAGKITVAYEVDSLEATKGLLRAGMAFALMPPIAFRLEQAAGQLISAELVAPELTQVTHVAVQSHWRIPRSTYKQFHRIFYDEWRSLVLSGEWPATWLLDWAVIEGAME